MSGSVFAFIEKKCYSNRMNMKEKNGLNSNKEPVSRKGSLSFAIRGVFLAITLIIVSSFFISVLLITREERKEYAKREATGILTTFGNAVSSEINNYSELSRLIITEDRLTQFLRADAEAVSLGMINDARYGIMDILNVKEGVDCVFIFREDMIVAATDRVTYKYDIELIESEAWKQNIYEAKGKSVVMLDSNGIAYKTDGTPVVTIGRAIYDIYSQKRTGIMLMNLSYSVFERILRQHGYDNVCLIGTNGEFIAGNREYYKLYDPSFNSGDIVFRDINTDSGTELLSGGRIGDLPLIMLSVSPYGTKGIPYGIIYVLGVLLLVFIVGTIYLGAFIARRITGPVHQLSHSMEKNKKSGELKKLEVQMPYRELETLAGDYNDMIDHVNELIDTLVDKEKTLRRAELRVLQEQIKPHFLYNSLETIGFLALDAGADSVHDALETLGSFYRNFLSKGDREISLLREVQIVRDYLSLQKLRYGDIIEDAYDIAPDTEKFVVPKLILQPLVENSIYHGIRLKGEKGLISITSRMKEGSLIVTVRDTGVGMSDEQIQKALKKERDENDASDASSFGLWGTIERIRMYCNDDDVVRIKSEQGEYTEISLMIRDMWHSEEV